MEHKEADKAKQMLTIRTGELAFTDEEYQKLLEAAQSYEDKLLLLIGVGYGMRRLDLVGIRIADIHLAGPAAGDQSTITFYENKKRRHRVLPVGPRMEQELRLYLNRLESTRKRREYLFPFRSRAAYDHLQRLCELAGIPRRPFHAMRATCIKRAQRKGWTVEETAKWVGDTIRVVQEHYTTPSNQEMVEVNREKEIAY